MDRGAVTRGSNKRRLLTAETRFFLVRTTLRNGAETNHNHQATFIAKLVVAH
jgi:hypothetical protein